MLPWFLNSSSHHPLKVVKLLLYRPVSDKTALAFRFWPRLRSTGRCLSFLGDSPSFLALFLIMWSVSVCSSCTSSAASQRAVMNVDSLFFVSLSWLNSSRREHKLAIVYARFLCSFLDCTFWEIKLRDNSLGELLQCEFSISIQVKTPDDSNNVLITCRDTHFKIEETFKVFVVNIFVTPIIDFLKQFVNVIIVTSS